MSLSSSEYRELLTAALPVTDADTVALDTKTLFTPRAHRQALNPDATIVQGGRGAGKTVWFKALQDDALRELAAEEYALPRLLKVTPLAGYGTALLPEQYPSQRTLAHLLTAFPPEDIWLTVVLHGLKTPQLTALDSWRERVDWLLANPETGEQELARADKAAGAGGKTMLFLFDALDRLHSKRDLADKLVGGILRVALDLRTRTRNIRAKVFIRPDMFNGIKLNFPDASKLLTNLADLTWSPTALYGLLFHQMGNAQDELADKFIGEGDGWEIQESRKLPPASLVSDQATQKEVFTTIAGPYMGANYRKGITYTWLPNHLTDGLDQVSPRSFLSALKRATEVTDEHYSSHQHALHWDGIRQGVQHASSIRVVEVREDMPWVSTAVGPLTGTQVPIEQGEVVQRWKESEVLAELAKLSEASDQAEEDNPLPTGPLHSDYNGLIEELIYLGVMSKRRNGKLDLPDVYRIAFGIGRRGGVPRVRS